MNREFLEGFQSATVNIMENGIDFAIETLKQFIGQDEYTVGYEEGIKMMVKRLNKQETVNRILAISEEMDIARVLKY